MKRPDFPGRPDTVTPNSSTRSRTASRESATRESVSRETSGVRPVVPLRKSETPAGSSAKQSGRPPRSAGGSSRNAGRPSRGARREPSATHKRREEAAEARHALREARKARKAFERNEVRRFTARVRRRRQAWATAVLSLVALGIFVGVGVFSPVMQIQTITVTGTTRVDPAAIVSQLSDQIGQPIPLVDVRRVEEVLRRQNLVESYSIESRPPHDLIIHVVERQPVAYMPVGTTFELKDAAGVTIEKSPTYPGGYPLLHVPKDEATGAAFEAAIGVVRALPSDLRSRISEVTATTADDVTFVLGDTGQRVFWGSADDPTIKIKALAGLMANWPPGSASEYDVSSKDNVVVR